jgi:hypothetical protein
MARDSLRPPIGFFSPLPDACALGDGAFGIEGHSRQLPPCSRRHALPKEEEHRLERLRGDGVPTSGKTCGSVKEQRSRD